MDPRWSASGVWKRAVRATPSSCSPPRAPGGAPGACWRRVSQDGSALQLLAGMRAKGQVAEMAWFRDASRLVFTAPPPRDSFLTGPRQPWARATPRKHHSTVTALLGFLESPLSLLSCSCPAVGKTLPGPAGPPVPCALCCSSCTYILSSFRSLDSKTLKPLYRSASSLTFCLHP